jgi:hypothetical protein
VKIQKNTGNLECPKTPESGENSGKFPKKKSRKILENRQTGRSQRNTGNLNIL